jgi:hypothetical protein
MPLELTALSMGARAAESLSAATEPVIRGVTSRGVYLQTAPHAVVFLTRDPTHGPFTIHVEALPLEFSHLAPGDPVRLEGNHLDLVGEAITISLLGAETWSCPPPSGRKFSTAEQFIYLKEVTQIVLEMKGRVGLASLLADLVGLVGQPAQNADPLGLKEVLDGCLKALTANHERNVLHYMLRALGRGPGLTPSGDDLSAGMLLALRRGDPLAFSVDQIDWLADMVTAAAYEKTTTYSANLIDAAGDGEADERLLAACEGIFSGRPDPQATALALSHWGSSSGIDTLTGMTLVCLAASTANPSRPEEIV